MALKQMAPIAPRPQPGVADRASPPRHCWRPAAAVTVVSRCVRSTRSPAPSRPPAPIAAPARQRRGQPRHPRARHPDPRRPNRPSTSRRPRVAPNPTSPASAPDRIDAALPAQRPRRAGPQGDDRRRARSRHAAPRNRSSRAARRHPRPHGQQPALAGPGLELRRLRRGTPPTASARPRPPARSAGPARRSGSGPYLGESGGNELFYPNKADRPWKYVVLHHSANPAGQLRPDRRRAPQGAGLRRLRLSLRDRQRHGHRRRPDRGRPAVGQPEARRPLPERQELRDRRVRDRHLLRGRPRQGTPHATPGGRGQGPRRLPRARVTPSTPARVETHSHLAATPTVCPGKFFPTGTFAAGLAQRTPRPRPSRPVPTSWRVARRDVETVR